MLHLRKKDGASFCKRRSVSGKKTLHLFLANRKAAFVGFNIPESKAGKAFPVMRRGWF
jgi:hypothetical protein